jgi:hypothetical protein
VTALEEAQARSTAKVAATILVAFSHHHRSPRL